MLHSVFTSAIYSILLQEAFRSRGFATTIARGLAREIATFSGLRLYRNSMPQGTSPADEAVIDTMTIAASWPWKLSTVRTPSAGRKHAVG